MKNRLFAVSVAMAAFGYLTSGAQADSSSRLTILKSTLVLPADGSFRTCTVSARRDALIVAFYTDNTPTSDGNNDFEVEGLRLAGSSFIGGTPCSIAGMGRLQARDMLRNLARCASNDTFGPIPLAKGDTFEVDFSTPNGANDVIIDVTFAVQSRKSPKLKDDCSKKRDEDAKKRDDDSDDDDDDD